MTELSPELLHALCEVIVPHVRRAEDRKSLFDEALIGSPVRDQIDERGSANKVANDVVTRLFAFGTLEDDELALTAFLSVIRKRVGTNRRTSIDCLIDAVNDAALGGADHVFEEAVFVRLDYSTQTTAFQVALEQNRVCGFLINGGPEDGHHILINRLLRKFARNVPIIKVRFKQAAQGVDVPSVWKQIYREIGRGRRLSRTDLESIKRQVIASVRTQLKTRHVIFLFDEAEVLPESRHDMFLDELWRPLVSGVQENPLPESDKSLLVFVTDFGTQVRSSFPQKVEQLNQPWGPRILPKLTPFDEMILQSWIDGLRGTNLDEDLVVLLENELADIMEDTGGVPIETMRRLCDTYRFGFFDDKESLWQIN